MNDTNEAGGLTFLESGMELRKVLRIEFAENNDLRSLRDQCKVGWAVPTQ